MAVSKLLTHSVRPTTKDTRIVANHETLCGLDVDLLVSERPRTGRIVMRSLLAVVLLSAPLVGIAGGQEQDPRNQSKTLNEWIEKLQDKDVAVRRSAAMALKQMGAEAKQAVPALIKALQDKDHHVRSRAASTLGKIGPEAEEAISNLIELLQDKNKGVRWYAAIGLGEIGPKAKRAIPALIRILEGEDRDVRWIAAEALGRIGPEAKQAIPALTRALQDKRFRVRTRATTALWLIRGGAREAHKINIYPHGDVKDGLAAFLMCRGNRFKVGQPIPLSYGVVLVGDGLEVEGHAMAKLRLRVWRPFRPLDPLNVSWFEVTGPNGKKVPYHGMAMDFAHTQPVEELSALLHHRQFAGMTHPDLGESFEMNKPGTYKVRWSYKPWFKGGPWVGKLMSEEVEFEIVGDAPAEDPPHNATRKARQP